LVLCQFFYENCGFFDISEIPITSDSSILIIFSKNHNQWFFGSENFKELKTVNCFYKSNNCTTLIQTSNNGLNKKCSMKFSIKSTHRFLKLMSIPQMWEPK